MSKATDIKTFVDEAGLNCLVRNLKPEQDSDIALLCGLPIPVEHEKFCRDAVRPFYDLFCKAAPPDAKRHITDAFASDDENWRQAANAARQGIFELVRRHRMIVVYAARRARIARRRFDTEAAQRMNAVADIRTSCYRVPGLDRPARDNVLGDAMTWFAICTNEFLKKLTKIFLIFILIELMPLWWKNMKKKYPRCATYQAPAILSEGGI